MAQLVPTPIIDRNGKATTVHRREGKPTRSTPALASARPAVAPAGEPRPAVASVKLTSLPAGARALRVAAELAPDLGFGSVPLDTRALSALLADRGTRTVTVPEDTAYDFLRLGIRLDGAALLTELGVAPEAASQTAAADHLDGTFAVASERQSAYRKNICAAVDRLQEAGVPVAKASKALENGLQDEHLDQALDVDQLVQLFGRWTFKSVAGRYTRDRVRQDDVMMAFITGTIAFQFRTAAMADLKSIEYDVRTMTAPDDPMHRAFTEDREGVDAVVGKLLSTPEFMSDHGYNPVTSLYSLTEAAGRGVLDLDRPGLARGRSVEQARFIEDVFRAAKADDPKGTHWGHHSIGDTVRTFVGRREYVQLWQIDLLQKAGLTPGQAYDGLVVRKLTTEQLTAAHRDGIASSLMDGAL